MELHLPVYMITFILFAGVAINNDHVSSSMITPEMYWKNALPNNPMPTVIKSSLQSVDNHGNKNPFVVPLKKCPGGKQKYDAAATRKDVDDFLKERGDTYMLETEMIPGRVVEVRLKTENYNKATFLPREASKSIPFSSNKLPEIFKKFSIEPNSREAAAVKQTIKSCEQSHDGEDKLCATSLEAMVSFTTSKLGNHITSFSSSTSTSGKIKYAITGVKKLVDYGSPSVVCHKELYPYAIFSCHQVEMTAVYGVSLVGFGDGIKVKAVVVCHKDTSWWSPKHVSFQVLKVKPGKTTPVCHFLDDHSIVWTK